MPIVTIQITREGTTAEQKAALIKGATDLMVDVLNKPPSLTFVVIQEVELEDWGVGGLPVKEYRRQSEAGSTGGQVGYCLFRLAPEAGDQFGRGKRAGERGRSRLENLGFHSRPKRIVRRPEPVPRRSERGESRIQGVPVA